MVDQGSTEDLKKELTEIVERLVSALLILPRDAFDKEGGYIAFQDAIATYIGEFTKKCFDIADIGSRRTGAAKIITKSYVRDATESMASPARAQWKTPTGTALLGGVVFTTFNMWRTSADFTIVEVVVLLSLGIAGAGFFFSGGWTR
ncbi:MAG: hypothetical protein HYY02_00575 [Chloroflexi bacterium]|nr:hypothetical protein [Chloroflexota bacterium]